jgi:hypothetical protein
MTTDQKRDSWHVGKEIPIATIGVLICQTIGVIWLAASTVAKVDFMRETLTAQQITQAAIDRRQDEDAKRTDDRILAELREIKSTLNTLIMQRQK